MYEVARPLLPYALAFAAGAMIFVVVEEVVPESQSGGYSGPGDHGGSGGIHGDDDPRCGLRLSSPSLAIRWE